MILILLALFWNQGYDSSIPLTSDSCQYLIAYNYILENNEVAGKINNVFQFARNLENRSDFSYCVDSNLIALDLGSFDNISDSLSNIKIIQTDNESLPPFLKNISSCQNTNLNLRFSYISNNLLTIEISARMFNPLGGCAKGPSVEYLFVFNDKHKIVKTFSQEYNNG